MQLAVQRRRSEWGHKETTCDAFSRALLGVWHVFDCRCSQKECADLLGRWVMEMACRIACVCAKD